MTNFRLNLIMKAGANEVKNGAGESEIKKFFLKNGINVNDDMVDNFMDSVR